VYQCATSKQSALTSRPESLDCSTALLQMRHLHNCYQSERQDLNHSGVNHGMSDMIDSGGFRIDVGPEGYIRLTKNVKL
jgi:hypothetical protein